MRVAILTPTFSAHDGVARVAYKQAVDCAAQGHEVTVFTLEADFKPGDFNVEIIGTPTAFLWRRIYWLLFPLDVAKINKYVKQLKYYDITISHEYPMQWFSFFAKKCYGVPFTYHAHGITPASAFNRLHERIYMRLIHPLWRASISNANKVNSVSCYLQTYLKDTYNIDSQVIYNKSDKTVFHNKLDRSIIRKRYGYGDDIPVILFVGRIDPYKGVHLLVEAFNIVKNRFPRAKLIIVGKANYQYYLNDIKKKGGGSVVVAGYVADEELPYYYAACDIYATGSVHENFNIPLIEAQLCGKPVVAFDLCSHPEVMQNNVSGFLVKPRDCRQMADKLLLLLQDNKLSDQMGAAAHSWASTNFGY